MSADKGLRPQPFRLPVFEDGQVGDLDRALRRLNAALEAAEGAVARTLDAADAARERRDELQAFADDRQRLAELLDVSAAKAEAAETDRLEIGRRLDAAIETVRSVIEEAR